MSNIITDLEKSLPPIQGQFQDINITSRVQDEIDFWNGKREDNPLVFDRLKQYWDYVNVSDWSPTGTPWSSAFISYQLRGKDFPRTSAHRIYVQDIIDNKHPSWMAFSLPKTKDIKLNVGDVLIKPRSGNYNFSHGDIVYKIVQGKAFLVGGNLGDSAKITKVYNVDSDNVVQDSVEPYKIILKKKGMGPGTKVLIPLVVLGLATIFIMR